MLVNFVQAEICKFKGTKVFFVMLIGAIIVPLFMAISHIFNFTTGDVFVSSFNFTVTSILSFLLIIFAAMMINILFNVDLKNDTLKSIIPLPVSASEYLNGKLATLLVWMIGFVLVAWIASLVLFTVFGMGFDFNTVINTLGQLIFGAILIFLIMTPVVFVYLLTKSQNLSLIVTILFLAFPFISLFAGDNFPFLTTIADYAPWSYASSLVTNAPISINIGIAYAVIILIFIVGYIASYLCLKNLYVD